MLDIHTHILPGMDDGSRSVGQSIAMLEREAQQGMHVVALTPHYHADRDSPRHFIKRRKDALDALHSAATGRADLPRLLAGAEVAYFDGMCRGADTDMLCIGDTNAMLIEMPFCRWTQRMYRELEELRFVRGIQPVLAHAERYIPWQPPGFMERIRESGMMIQVNASFVTRWQTALKATAMLKRRGIHFIASDCHDMERRPPAAGEARRRIERRMDAAAAFLRGQEELLLEE